MSISLDNQLKDTLTREMGQKLFVGTQMGDFSFIKFL